MSKIRFAWDNKADDATITSTSEHLNFPDDNVTHRWHTRSWRSRYGAGSGWGTFLITAASSDRLDFEETGGVNLAAILTPGTYTADSLCTHLKAQMEAVGGSTYTWEYLDDTNRFKVTSNGAGGGGILNLEWVSGPNTARSVGDVLGHDMGAGGDDGGALTYTAEYDRIHTREEVIFDLGSTQAIQAIAIKNNNFQSDASVSIHGNPTNAWASPAVTYTFGAIDNDLMVYFWASAQSYRWWKIIIEDVDNPDGYVEMGRVFLGGYFSPTRGFKEDYGDNIIDPSDVMFSKGGQVSSNEEDEYISVDLSFPAATADFATFKSIFNDRGRRKDFFVCLDTDNFATETYYMKFASQFEARHIYNREYYWVQVQLEELR